MTFNDFLRDYGLFIAFTIFFIILILIALFLLVPRLKKVEEEVPMYDKNALILSLGGSENIISILPRGSRLTVSLNDVKKADIEALKKHGVNRVVVMQDKLVLLVNKAIADLFNELS